MSDVHFMSEDLPSISNRHEESMTSESFRTLDNSFYEQRKSIACISESRGNASEIGMAIFDFEECVCKVYQFLDTPTFQYTLKILLLHSPKLVNICPYHFIRFNCCRYYSMRVVWLITTRVKWRSNCYSNIHQIIWGLLKGAPSTLTLDSHFLKIIRLDIIMRPLISKTSTMG